ncbi:MAG: transcriptional regulator GcvA [Pseudomonadota bacterium]
MPSDRLPPLTALRAFEAAARHMSFARAAEELSVTPAALSFQIKSLEEHLGTPVFRRLNRAVALTEAGQMLVPGVQDGFASLSAAWRLARRRLDTRTLTVTAGPALTAKWLAPRLFQFAEAHPEVELRFSATLRLLDFDRDEIDVALRYGYGPDPGFFSEAIIRDWFTPMMSPAMAERCPTPASLKNAVLLREDDIRFLNPPVNWGVWFRAAGIDGAPPGGPRFNQSDHAIDAAVSGTGVVLGRTAFAAKALTEGQLVAPFDIAITTDAHYRFLCPQGTENQPKTQAFLDWIRDQAKDLEPLRQGKRFIPAGNVA